MAPVSSQICPRPLFASSVIQMAHGSGGRLMHELLARLLPLLPGTVHQNVRHDGAIIPVGPWENLAFTTDSYVVRPLFFPGGDIGKIAVNGTVNDLAMCGAQAKALSCSLIIEEGFSVATLERVMASMAEAARVAGVDIVTGDTKVIDGGSGGNLFINTAGIGAVNPGITITPSRIVSGDAIIISGDIGRHAVAVMSARSDLTFNPPIESDSMPLTALVQALIQAGIPIHCLRDATRGGLASTLVELAESSGCGMAVVEKEIPVSTQVRGVCEILGLDPVYLANEGCLVAIVAADFAESALKVMRTVAAGERAQLIGRVTSQHPGVLMMAGPYGTKRTVPMLSGDQLPRIC